MRSCYLEAGALGDVGITLICPWCEQITISPPAALKSPGPIASVFPLFDGLDLLRVLSYASATKFSIISRGKLCINWVQMVLKLLASAVKHGSVVYINYPTNYTLPSPWHKKRVI